MATIDDVYTLLQTVDGKVDALQADITAIKAKTDNLPSDPADESLLEAAIAAIPATSAGPVWDELLSAHTGAGTMGSFMTKVKGQIGIVP